MTKLFMSGRTVDPMNLRSADLDIIDIGHNLSHICRFTGSFPFHYSVAHHSLLVYEHMTADGHVREARLAGLLHDAAEYVFNDLSSEIKHHPLLAGYRRIEHETSKMILANYGVNPCWLEIVKPYDEMMYHHEVAVRDLGSKNITASAPKAVFCRFMAVFHQLYRA